MPHNWTPRLRQMHRHVCQCQDFYVCHQPPDRCAVTDPWTCPSCQQQQMDDYFSDQELQTREEVASGDLRQR